LKPKQRAGSRSFAQDDKKRRRAPPLDHPNPYAALPSSPRKRRHRKICGVGDFANAFGAAHSEGKAKGGARGLGIYLARTLASNGSPDTQPKKVSRPSASVSDAQINGIIWKLRPAGDSSTIYLFFAKCSRLSTVAVRLVPALANSQPVREYFRSRLLEKKFGRRRSGVKLVMIMYAMLQAGGRRFSCPKTSLAVEPFAWSLPKQTINEH
jgi:hypothetical protein